MLLLFASFIFANVPVRTYSPAYVHAFTVSGKWSDIQYQSQPDKTISDREEREKKITER